MQHLQSMSSLLAAAAVLLLLLLLAPLVSTTSCNWDWLVYKDYCYAYYNQSAYWYDGEMTCKEQGGHLVSIADDHENRLVGKLSLCKSVWIGLYARDVTKLDETSDYSWTDESVKGNFSRHNFSEETSIHQPLIRSERLSWYNAFYHEQHPFICKSPKGADDPNKPYCPSRMKYFQGYCYLFSGFEANFIEANFYCQNHSTNLVSVYTEQELHFLNTLDLSTDACEIRSVWIGLVKLSPCDPDEAGRELCYRWTDFSGKHRDFPKWAEGQPEPATVESVESYDEQPSSRQQRSCVTLSGDNLATASCSERHAFICKIGAGALSEEAFQALDVKPTARVEKVAEAAATVVGNNETQSNNSDATSAGEAAAAGNSTTVEENAEAMEQPNSGNHSSANESNPVPPANETVQNVKEELQPMAKQNFSSEATTVGDAAPEKVELPSQSASSNDSSKQSPTEKESSEALAEVNSSINNTTSSGSATIPEETAAAAAAATKAAASNSKPRKDAEERGDMPWSLEDLFDFGMQKPAERKE